MRFAVTSIHQELKEIEYRQTEGWWLAQTLFR